MADQTNPVVGMLDQLETQTKAHDDLTDARSKTRSALKVLADAGAALDKDQQARFDLLTGPKEDRKWDADAKSYVKHETKKRGS